MVGRDFFKLVFLLILLGAGAFAVAMRKEDDGINSYTVARAKPSDRMLGAIITRGTQAWFFKMTGSNKAVQSKADEFRQLIESVKFGAEPSAEPTWTLPSGWEQRPGSQLRFATLVTEADGESLECSVSMLPFSGQSIPSYLLANINRWRDQLKIGKLSPDELSRETTTVKLDGDLTATLVDYEGELGGASRGPAPFAKDGSGGGSPVGQAPVQADEKITYDKPEGWIEGQLEISRGGITVRRAAAFDVRDGDQHVEITATKLPASAVLANVNRWRSQIGLGSMAPDQFEQAKSQINLAGSPADYVQFVGETESVLGVIAVRGPFAWFVKLQGSSELAAREREHFEQFVKSIRF